MDVFDPKLIDTLPHDTVVIVGGADRSTMHARLSGNPIVAAIVLAKLGQVLDDAIATVRSKTRERHGDDAAKLFDLALETARTVEPAKVSRAVMDRPRSGTEVTGGGVNE